MGVLVLVVFFVSSLTLKVLSVDFLVSSPSAHVTWELGSEIFAQASSHIRVRSHSCRNCGGAEPLSHKKSGIALDSFSLVKLPLTDEDSCVGSDFCANAAPAYADQPTKMHQSSSPEHGLAMSIFVLLEKGTLTRKLNSTELEKSSGWEEQIVQSHSGSRFACIRLFFLTLQSDLRAGPPLMYRATCSTCST